MKHLNSFLAQYLRKYVLDDDDVNNKQMCTCLVHKD